MDDFAENGHGHRREPFSKALAIRGCQSWWLNRAFAKIISVKESRGSYLGFVHFEHVRDVIDQVYTGVTTWSVVPARIYILHWDTSKFLGFVP